MYLIFVSRNSLLYKSPFIGVLKTWLVCLCSISCLAAMEDWLVQISYSDYNGEISVSFIDVLEAVRKDADSYLDDDFFGIGGLIDYSTVSDENGNFVIKFQL